MNRLQDVQPDVSEEAVDHTVEAEYPTMQGATQAMSALEWAGIEAANVAMAGPAIERAFYKRDTQQRDTRVARDMIKRAGGGMALGSIVLGFAGGIAGLIVGRLSGLSSYDAWLTMRARRAPRWPHRRVRRCDGRRRSGAQYERSVRVQVRRQRRGRAGDRPRATCATKRWPSAPPRSCRRSTRAACSARGRPPGRLGAVGRSQVPVAGRTIVAGRQRRARSAQREAWGGPRGVCLGRLISDMSDRRRESPSGCCVRRPCRSGLTWRK